MTKFLQGMSEITSNLVLLKLSLQNALLGEVSGNLASVTAGIENKHIIIHAYFFGSSTSEDVEAI